MIKYCKIGALSGAFFLILVLSGCGMYGFFGSSVLSSSVFRSARVLKPGDKKLSIKTVELLPTGVGFAFGLPSNAQIFAAVNAVNGLVLLDEPLYLFGPEACISKNLVNLGDIFYITTSITGEMYLGIKTTENYNKTAFGFIGEAGFDLGIFPFKEFGLFAQLNSAYFYMQTFDGAINYIDITSVPGISSGIGIGLFVGNFEIKLAAKVFGYITWDESYLYEDYIDVYPNIGIEVGWKF
jgi:hypothetical protein